MEEAAGCYCRCHGWDLVGGGEPEWEIYGGEERASRTSVTVGKEDTVLQTKASG